MVCVKMKKRSAIIIAIILISIGFAAVSTTLIINGISSISENQEDFDIYFSSAMIDKEDYTNEIISKDKKTITFETKNLKSINEETTLDYEVTNGSTQYDASGKINVNVEENEYVEVTNAFDDTKNLSARETRNGTLTIKLKKGSTEEKSIKVTVNLEFNAEEREKIDNTPIVENTYSISGYFADKEGNVLPNVNLAIFSETPRFVTTDDHGYFYVGGLERGRHEIYYINESEVNKSKEKIEKNKIDKVSITTSSEKKIIFDKGYEIKNSKVEETHVEKVTKTLISNNGETSEIELEINTLYKGLPTPKRTGYRFLYWKDEEGRKITEITYVVNTSENKLYAEYTEEEYIANISISNGTSSSSSIKVIYGKTNTVKVTPSSGYYISGGSCTSGYTITGLTTGASATGSQTITINNNSNASDTTCTISTAALCPYTTGQVVGTYNYTGGVQSFTAACSGTYKLEVWGAQGGGSNGGKGGYSAGTKQMAQSSYIYIVVGGTTSSGTGGYNGGGSISGNVYGGGGATHMATTNHGVLSNYNSYRGDVLIVAGGGGGSGNGYAGGFGGGITGGSGTGDNYGTGGSQNSGGSIIPQNSATGNPGVFGKGGNSGWNNEPIGGGGGGWYGGASGGGYNNNGSGGGGSGYIGGVTEGMMSNGARAGAGYARITFVSLG